MVFQQSPQWTRVSSRVKDFLDKKQEQPGSNGHRGLQQATAAMIVEEHGARPRTADAILKTCYMRTPLRTVLLYSDLQERQERRRQRNLLKMKAFVKKEQTRIQGAIEQEAVDALFFPYEGPEKNRDERDRTNWMGNRTFHPYFCGLEERTGGAAAAAAEADAGPDLGVVGEVVTRYTDHSTAWGAARSPLKVCHDSNPLSSWLVSREREGQFEPPGTRPPPVPRRTLVLKDEMLFGRVASWSADEGKQFWQGWAKHSKLARESVTTTKGATKKKGGIRGKSAPSSLPSGLSPPGGGRGASTTTSSATGTKSSSSATGTSATTTTTIGGRPAVLAQVLRGINGKMTEEEAKKIIFRLSRKPKHWFADELLLQEAHRVVDWEAKKVHKGKDFDTRCCFTVPSNLNETKMAAQREYFLEHYPKEECFMEKLSLGRMTLDDGRSLTDKEKEEEAAYHQAIADREAAERAKADEAERKKAEKKAREQKKRDAQMAKFA